MSNVEEFPVLDGIAEPAEAPDSDVVEVPQVEPSVEAAEPRTSSVEEEGDIAADYLEELLDIADLDGDIDIEVRNGRTYISILAEDEESEELRRLVGHNGATLDALQELTRLAVLTATGNRSRLVLDITGYRQGRAGELQKIAEEAVSKAKESGEAIALAPMSAYERKLVHDAVATLGLHSESDGEGVNRHIVISLNDA